MDTLQVSTIVGTTVDDPDVNTSFDFQAMVAEGVEALKTIEFILEEPRIDDEPMVDVLQVSAIVGTTVDGPDDDDDSEIEILKIHFFTLIPGLQHITIDPAAVPDCGPLRARPWKPLPLSQPHETNMAWVGILMGAPEKVFKPAKCKAGKKWVITDRMENDVYMRLKKSGSHQFVDSAGTIVAEKDI